MKIIYGRLIAFVLALNIGILGFNFYSYATRPAEQKQISKQAQMSSIKIIYFNNSLGIEIVHAEDEFSVFKITTPNNAPADMPAFWKHLQEDCEDKCKAELECTCTANSLETEVSEDLQSMIIKTEHSKDAGDKVQSLVLKWMMHRYTAFKSEPAPPPPSDPNMTTTDFCCH